MSILEILTAHSEHLIIISWCLFSQYVDFLLHLYVYSGNKNLQKEYLFIVIYLYSTLLQSSFKTLRGNQLLQLHNRKLIKFLPSYSDRVPLYIRDFQIILYLLRVL